MTAADGLKTATDAETEKPARMNLGVVKAVKEKTAQDLIPKMMQKIKAIAKMIVMVNVAGAGIEKIGRKTKGEVVLDIEAKKDEEVAVGIESEVEAKTGNEVKVEKGNGVEVKTEEEVKAEKGKGPEVRIGREVEVKIEKDTEAEAEKEDQEVDIGVETGIQGKFVCFDNILYLKYQIKSAYIQVQPSKLLALASHLWCVVISST